MFVPLWAHIKPIYIDLGPKMGEWLPPKWWSLLDMGNHMETWCETILWFLGTVFSDKPRVTHMKQLIWAITKSKMATWTARDMDFLLDLVHVFYTYISWHHKKHIHTIYLYYIYNIIIYIYIFYILHYFLLWSSSF